MDRHSSALYSSSFFCIVSLNDLIFDAMSFVELLSESNVTAIHLLVEVALCWNNNKKIQLIVVVYRSTTVLRFTQTDNEILIFPKFNTPILFRPQTFRVQCCL